VAREPLHVLHIEDEITIGPKPASPAAFLRHIDYFFWAADAIRHRFANEGAAGYAQAVLKELQSIWPSIAEAAPIEVSDDPARNCVTVTSSYEIRDCWKPGKSASHFDLVVASGSFRGELQPLSGVNRKTDIYLGRPRRITSVLKLNMPCGWVDNGWLHRFETSRARYTDNFLIEGRTIIDSRELVIDAQSLPAAEAKAYGDLARKLQENLLIIWGQKWFGGVRPRGIIKRNLLRIALFTFWIGWVLVLLIDAFLENNAYHPR
jgi:hypothetical protein